MKCNLASPTLLSIVPASSLAPLALGAFAIAYALATQRLNAEPAHSGRHGRRSRGRPGARTDRRAEKEGRRPAPSAAVGLPEATAEIIASLGEHRVLSTEQVRAIHLPGRSLRRTQQILAGIEEAGLVHHVDTRIAPRRLWFVSQRGAALAFELVGLEAPPRVLQASDAAGPLRAHTLAVNDAAICFLEAARERGDEFGPFSWHQEIAHPMSRGRGRRRRTLFADAVLTYLRREENGTALEQRFLELDRATLSVDRLVAELSRYAQLYRAADAEGEPLWRNRYPVFPRVLCVLTGASREALRRGARSRRCSCASTPRWNVRAARCRSASAASKTCSGRGRSRRSSGKRATASARSTGSAIPPMRERANSRALRLHPRRLPPDRRGSLPRRWRAIVVAHDRAAGRRANAPGPVPKA